MSHDNARTLENGLAKALTIIEDTIYNSLLDAAERLLIRVATNRQFIGFTGNTQTSYACGIYMYGRLVGMVYQNNWKDAPRRAKVRKGHVVYLSNPYEGNPRLVEGKVDTGEAYGIETSTKFLESYNKAPKKGFALVMTTGTEYSVYIEQAMSLDVLTNTYQNAAEIINRSWRKIDSAA